MTGQTRLDELKAWIQSQGWRWQAGKPIQHGEQIVVTDGKHQALVNFYPKRGSLVPGGTDSPLRAALVAWMNGDPPPSAPLPSLPLQSMASTRLDALKQFVHERGWSWGTGADIPYGEQIVVSDGSASALVNFWPKRGKMDVQGADSPLKVALRAWVNEERSVTSGDLTSIPGTHIGMDESGKGDWFGPLVVAAVYVTEQTASALQRAGVKDSKDLNWTSIRRIADQIEHIVPPQHRHVWPIDPDTYNQLYAECQNINLVLADAYARVAEEVWHSAQSQVIVCDQFSQRADRLESAFATKGLPCPIQQHHAESASVAVAAASILASAAFTEALAQLGRQAGLDAPLPKGASDVETLEATARRIMEVHGQEALEHYAKLNFKPIQALLGTESSRDATIMRQGAQPRSGPPVTIQCKAWRLQYHPNGFWRFQFSDGAILDWYEGTTGRLDVRGRGSAPSYRILLEKAHGKVWQGSLEAVQQSVDKHIPCVVESSVPSVLGTGWRRTDTVLGARFDFTDGGVLNYYHGKDTLLIQGTPSVVARTALEALPSPFWEGLDKLTDTLRALFPDWRLGEQLRPDEAEMTAAEDRALRDTVDWQALWPASLGLRMSANEKSPCQRAMVEDWAAVLRHHQGKRHMLAHAPTGLGKTLAALVPALAWVAEAPDRRRVYYLVNRIAQHENPLRELRNNLAARFEAQTSQRLQVVDLVSRDLLCTYPYARPLPQSCKDARDGARFDLLPGNVASWQEVKEHLAGSTCPYHTLQGLMTQAHVVIADYWWLLSPWAQQTGLTDQAGLSPADSILVIDEAHNLAARVRSYLDVDETVARIIESVQKASTSVRRCLTPIIDAVSKSTPEGGVLPSALLRPLGGAKMVQEALGEIAGDVPGDAGISTLERVLRLLLQPDESVVIYRTEDYITGEPRLVFRWVDPTLTMQAGYARVYASLSMSGTLAAPTDNDAELRYQTPLLGLPEQATLPRKYASPFPSRNQRWIYCTDTCGTYKRRGRHLNDYGRHIVGVGKATPGVTAVFFSSYAFLEKVRTSILDRSERGLIVVEKRTDSEDADTSSDMGEYEQHLRTMVEQNGRAYLFAVYQGKLSEGADFRGNLIKSIVCVSIPMEYPSLFHQRLAAQYTTHFAAIAEELGDDLRAKAHEYALDRLSLSWVLQSCGRGIRSEDDRCAFVLLDERYHEYGWRRFLEPRPYNVRRPGKNVMDLHQEYALAPAWTWDVVLLRCSTNRTLLATAELGNDVNAHVPDVSKRER